MTNSLAMAASEPSSSHITLYAVTVSGGSSWRDMRTRASRSRVAQMDGPRSVQASFRIPEVTALARRAGLDNARIVPCWPQRFVLTWSRE